MSRFWRTGGLAAVLAVGATLALADATPAHAQMYRKTYTGFVPAPGYNGASYAPAPSYYGQSYAAPPTYLGNGPYGIGYYAEGFARPMVWTSRLAPAYIPPAVVPSSESTSVPPRPIVAPRLPAAPVPPIQPAKP